MEQENFSNKLSWNPSKNTLIFISIILLAIVMIVSILREKIVSRNDDITTVNGVGKISYQPDIAIVTLGVQVDRAVKAEDALNKLSNSINNIISAVKVLGVSDEDIQTQSYSLFPHYDTLISGGLTSFPTGYDANQQIAIKVRGVDKDPGLSGRVIEEAGKAGTNQVVGVNFDVSNLDQLKQKARLEAIADARSKSAGLAKAAGVKSLGEVVSWYENVIKSPDSQNMYGNGMGGTGAEKISSVPSPQVTSGVQEIIIEMSLNYRIK